MPIPRGLCCLIALCVVSTLIYPELSLAAVTSSGQSFPSKPLRVVTGGAGAGNDFAARLVAQGLSLPESLGQQVVVDNRASGFIPAAIVAKSAPDGYTLLFYGGVVWISPLLQDNVPYDPQRDLAPITFATNSPLLLVVNPKVPATTVKELIALAKSKPGALNYASLASGTATHLATELFKAMAGVDIVRVPYKNGATQLADLIGGQVHMTFGTGGAVTPHVKAGRLRALAVTSPQPSALFPDVPALAASGLPGFQAGSKYGMFAPAKTPAAIISRLNLETVRVLRKPDVREKMLGSGLEVVASTPAEFAAMMKSDIALLGKVIRDKGIRAE